MNLFSTHCRGGQPELQWKLGRARDEADVEILYKGVTARTII